MSRRSVSTRSKRFEQVFLHAVRYQAISRNNIDVIYNFFVGVEARFHLNRRCESAEYEIREYRIPLQRSLSRSYPRKVTVPYGVTRKKIIGPRFFEKMYVNNPRTIRQLKSELTEKIHSIRPRMLTTVAENGERKVQAYDAENGGYIQDIFFHTRIEIKFRITNFLINKVYR